MIIHNSLDNIPALPEPIALTIGTFDGVHLGHQHLFAELKKHGAPVVVTFSNHPSEILRPFDVPAPILTLNEKLELFAQFGIAMAIVIPFTHALSQIPYDEFLKKLTFSTIVGGEDMRIGARGEGNRETLQQLGFKTVFLPKFTLDGTIISARLIRELIKTHQIDQASKLLGHTKGILWLDSLAGS
ncbi:MAG: FAD synthetase family protein [Rhabdochlamydiaceae bacterium]